MGWFTRRSSAIHKEEALILIRHLQIVFAYQQLAVEIYNDALASIVGDTPVGEEVSTGVHSVNPNLVLMNVIPALEKKIEIIRLMEKESQQAKEYAKGELLKPYQKMKSSIGIALKRANFQHQGFMQFVIGLERVNITKLDKSEKAAMSSAAIALNEIIQKVGLTTEEIVEEAINSVRDSIGLSPLDTDSFRSRYFRSLKGEKVRFFAD